MWKNVSCNAYVAGFKRVNKKLNIGQSLRFYNIQIIDGV